MDAKIREGVERYVEKYQKQHLLGVLCMEYNKYETEMEKQQCYERIKEILIELYGLNGIMNNV